MKSDIDYSNVRRMDLNLLWVFYALLRYHKVTIAAERLAMTQSAVSQALARLRSVFGDPLFVRTGHGLRPTPRALELEPNIRQVIETAIATFEQKPDFDPSSEADIRIGIPDNVSHALTSFVGITRRDAPGLRYSVRCLWGRKGLDALMQDEIDLALFHIAKAPPEIERQILYFESYAVIARQDHVLAARPLDLEGYVAADHAVASFAGDKRGLVDARLGWSSLGAPGASFRPFPSFAQPSRRSPPPT